MDYNEPSLLRVNEKTKLCKLVYQKLVANTNPVQNKREETWETDLGAPIDNWKHNYTQAFKLCIDTKLREFQYKYLLRILPDNSKLYRYNISSSRTCDFCLMNIDSNKHMFWDCHIVQIFWKEISRFITNIFEVDTSQINYSNVTFCNFKPSNESHEYQINFVILLAKYFIFKSKCEGNTPIVEAFVPYFSKRLQTEAIATAKSKLHIFHGRWTIALNRLNA